MFVVMGMVQVLVMMIFGDVSGIDRGYGDGNGVCNGGSQRITKAHLDPVAQVS